MLATTTEATPSEDVFVPLNFALFCAIVAATMIGIPLYGYYYGFSLFDWILSLVMYIVTGMGITVGYHRLVSHQSFECPELGQGLYPRRRWLGAAKFCPQVGRRPYPPSRQD